MRKDNSSSFLFLSPHFTIKNRHLSKRDVENIKISLSHKISATSLVVACILLLLNLVMFFCFGIETGWRHIEVYGLTSFLGEVGSIAGTLIVIAFEIISLKSNDTTTKNRFAHLSSTLTFIVMGYWLFMSFYADASMGYISDSPAISPSLTLISLLLLIQPVFWTEAIILDGSISLGLIVLSIYGTNKYHIQGLMYYLFIAFVFPIGSYLIISILFYAETQKYCEELRNEALHNTAIYDELTLCKNRHALKETLEEYAKRWENDKETKLVVMMFDIDEFKLYNDQYSHMGGDYCLKSIADCVRKIFPSPTLDFYRYGGEEFLLFMEVSDNKQAEMIVEKIRLAVKSLGIVAAKGAPCEYVTISVGGSIIKANEMANFDGVIQSVDEYLYQAKGSGKNISVLDGKIVK